MGSSTQLRARKVLIWRSRSCRWGIDMEVEILGHRYHVTAWTSYGSGM
jgi:hypothetical protein